MSHKIQVKNIVVTRAEGPSALCGVPTTAKSFEEVNAILFDWSDSVAARGGYDKCDFVVTFEDGKTYSGTYDLFHHSVKEFYSLKTHILDNCRFSANLHRPAHFSENDWLVSQKMNAPNAQEYTTFLETYDI